ncbi:MAG: YbhB/YbcL family Raf kinase inhibitor-like protein [Bacteroidia bacterium]
MISSNPFVKNEIKTLNISSEAFENGHLIPSKYTCDGENVNPQLEIGNIPEKTKSLVLIIDDPDAPLRTWIHWLVWNVSPARKIKMKSIPGIEGMNDFMQHHYGGPCPPSGMHHYHFKIYALDDMLYLNENATVHDVEKAMSLQVVAFGELIGLYKKPT